MRSTGLLPSNEPQRSRKMLSGLLWAIIAILVILWIVGFLVVHVSSGLIHLLLVIAVIVLIYNLFVGARSRRTL